MGNRFAAGKRAIAICDVCGFQYKLHKLKDLFVKGTNSHVKACPTCWNPSHPQLRLGELPINDPEALRNPRPDQGLTASRNFQGGWNPVGLADPFNLTPNRLVGRVSIGTVTVVTN